MAKKEPIHQRSALAYVLLGLLVAFVSAVVFTPIGTRVTRYIFPESEGKAAEAPNGVVVAPGPRAPEQATPAPNHDAPTAPEPMNVNGRGDTSQGTLALDFDASSGRLSAVESTPRPKNSSESDRERLSQPFQTKRIGQLEVTLNSCLSEPEGILCNAFINNVGAERQYCLVSKADNMMSRIIDERGNVSTPGRISLAEKTGAFQMWACASLPSGVPVASSLLFSRKRDAIDSTKHLQLVEFGFDIVNYASKSPTSFFVQFREVPVTE